MSFFGPEARAEQAALRLERERLTSRARAEVCSDCGGTLLVATAAGQPVLRCGEHGYVTSTRPRVSESLATRYRKAGTLSAAGMSYLEAQTLALSLANSIRTAEAGGRNPLGQKALLRQLEAEMGLIGGR